MSIGRTVPRVATSHGPKLALLPRRPAQLLVMAVFALAFWLRLTIFAPTELGLDGLLSVGIAARDWRTILDFSLRDVHPPLYYLFLSAWLHLVGPAFLVARWPSVASGVLALALLYHLLRLLGGRRIALTGLVITAVAPPAVFLAATVRDFAPAALLSLLTWLVFVRLLPTSQPTGAPSTPVSISGTAAQPTPDRHWTGQFHGIGRLVADPRIALVGLTTAAFLTWYVHALVWLLQVAITLRRPRQVRWPLLAGAVIALPWYVVFAGRLLGRIDSFGAAGRAPTDVAFGSFLGAASQAVIGNLSGLQTPAWLAMAWLLAVFLGCWTIATNGRPGLGAVLAGGTIAGVVGAWAIFRFWVGGEFLTRYFLLPVFFGDVALAFLIGSSRRRALWLGAIVTIVVPGLLFYGHFASLRPTHDPRADLWRWLMPRLRQGDVILVEDLADLGYLWLIDRRGSQWAVFQTQGAAFLQDDDPERVVRAITPSHADARTVWRVQPVEPVNAASVALTAALIERWQPIARWERGAFAVERYTGRIHWQPTAALFGGAIALQAIGLPDRVDDGDQASGLVPVVLQWRAVRPIEQDVTVFVHVVDAHGQLVSQHDGPPAQGTRPTSHWLPGMVILDLHWMPVPAMTAPGPYDVVVGLYHDQARLDLADGSSAYRIGRLDLTPGSLRRR